MFYSKRGRSRYGGVLFVFLMAVMGSAFLFTALGGVSAHSFDPQHGDDAIYLVDTALALASLY